VGECNDAFLNDIQGRHVKKEHVLEAIKNASTKVEEGVVGAGTGMISMGFKSGVGTSSRIIEEGNVSYHIGVLSVPNFGRAGDLIIKGKKIRPQHPPGTHSDDGSIIVVLATDAPLSSRQLHRLAKRAALGIARAGGYATHGSGDIIITFSNSYTISHNNKDVKGKLEILNEKHRLFNLLIKGAVEATQESIYNALTMAKTMVGRDNHFAEGLTTKHLLDIID
ncbi:MAG: P1 family peptidase, partial [Candidatus Heimdallarchaeaceae archaeon]